MKNPFRWLLRKRKGLYESGDFIVKAINALRDGDLSMQELLLLKAELEQAIAKLR